jgi:ArsR family transcriptional regulator, arsenate/arsenite/antimonite-responsive transcriptional repressor
MIDAFEELSEVYKALADKTRLHMLALLVREELCVCELVAILDMSQPSVSQHLRKLKQAGLVKERKTAQWVYYSLDNTKFALLQDIVDTLPDVEDEIELLKSQGLRVQCTL